MPLVVSLPVPVEQAVAGRQRKHQDNPGGNHRAAARMQQAEPERRAAVRTRVLAQQVELPQQAEPLRLMPAEAHPVEPGQQARKAVLPQLRTEVAVRRVKADRRRAPERTVVAVQQAAVRRLTAHRLMADRAVRAAGP